MLMRTIICCLLFGMAGCGASPEHRLETLQYEAKDTGLKPFFLETPQFKLFGHSRVSNSHDPIVVYIEGDGFSWIDRYTVSPNPTPRNPVGFKLAAMDNSPNLVYLARPCQYVPLETQPNCNRKYWTSHRFSREVIISYSRALDRLRAMFGNPSFHLVGFSGGAAIAAILAANRDDVLSLRTVGGNLDHVSLNRKSKVSPLSGSLNPIAYAKRLTHIPQIHYSSSGDEIIPAWVAQSFVAALENRQCARVELVSDIAKHQDWPSSWKRFVDRIPAC